jgi:hypothetical protein
VSIVADGSGIVAVGFCHAAQVTAGFTNSLLRLMMGDAYGRRRIAGVIARPGAVNISQDRNLLVREFLDDTAAGWLLMLDTDMTFDADVVERLLSAADPVTRPIVGGLCFGFRDGTTVQPVMTRLADRGDDRVEVVPVDDWPDGQLIQVHTTGAACLLVHRTVFEKIDAEGFSQVFPFFQEGEMGGYPVAEDAMFCLRAAAVGYPVHIDTSVQPGHLKQQLLTADLYRAQQGPG